jgi:hypothetical protein
VIEHSKGRVEGYMSAHKVMKRSERRIIMIDKTKTVIVLVILFASTSTGLAKGHHAIRHSHRVYAQVPAGAFEPPRMIEVRPGLWMGSYQCITDLDRGGRDCSSGI